MSNRIIDVAVVLHRLDPIQTELHVHVKLDELTAGAELKGRLIGPRSTFVSTIEIAYPLRECERGDNGHVVLRVVIPEPSWWTPKTPFLYEGPLELWQDGVLCERIMIRHGIRTLQLTPGGLKLNGKPFVVRGRMVDATLTEERGRALREAGFNAIWTMAPEIESWRIADRIGLFVLGSASDLAAFHELRHELTSHPSHFGWIFNRAELWLAPARQEELAMFYGVNTSAQSRPENADFVVCLESELAWLGDVDLPKLVAANRIPEPLPTRADVIGWIEVK